MKFDILTLFPEMFEPLEMSIIGRATSKKILEINLVNIRDFSNNKHNQVDDTPYGGGVGMLLKPDVVWRAYSQVKSENAKVIYLTPQGKTLNQAKVESLAKYEHLILLCGHYEGIDQRVIDKINPEEISIGDYVLTGGEIPAMVLVDSVSRYIQGVLKNGSEEDESFSYDGLLEYPQYTKPEDFEGMKVPEVLLSGHHENIAKWRRQEALRVTYNKRKDILDNANLTEEDKKFLESIENLKKGEI